MRALSKLVTLNQPDLVLFVGEALAGNDAVDQVSHPLLSRPLLPSPVPSPPPVLAYPPPVLAYISWSFVKE